VPLQDTRFSVFLNSEVTVLPKRVLHILTRTAEFVFKLYWLAFSIRQKFASRNMTSPHVDIHHGQATGENYVVYVYDDAELGMGVGGATRVLRSYSNKERAIEFASSLAARLGRPFTPEDAAQWLSRHDSRKKETARGKVQANNGKNASDDDSYDDDESSSEKECSNVDSEGNVYDAKACVGALKLTEAGILTKRDEHLWWELRVAVQKVNNY
jgi:hypothetical protein